MKLQDAFARVAVGIPITTEPAAADLIRIQDVIEVKTSMTIDEFMTDCVKSLTTDFGFDDEEDAATTCGMIKDRMIMDGVIFPGMPRKEDEEDNTDEENTEEVDNADEEDTEGEPKSNSKSKSKEEEAAKKKEAMKKKGAKKK
jgi:hypothetical protein